MDMTALPIRKEIEAELDALSEQQAVVVLEFIRAVKQEHPIVEAIEDDPLVGFISGPTNMAERTEEILRSEFGRSHSGSDPK
jgi:hypothetical protein